MNKAWLVAPLFVLALSGCEKETGPELATPDSAPETASPVPKATDDPAAVRPLASFAGMDDNGDGLVSSVEHAKAVQAIFTMMDADRDGLVTVAEMDAARDAVGGSTEVSSEKKIEAGDSDNDGRLTLAEFVGGANALFARMDLNNDDMLDRAEWDRGQATAFSTPNASIAAD